MAICTTCNQEMMTADGCAVELVSFSDDVEMKRSREHFNEPDGRCHDCNIVHGNLHHPGCDAERCPRCGGQQISCSCP